MLASCIAQARRRRRRDRQRSGPPEWDDTPGTGSFRPGDQANCTTCHAAMQTAPSGDTLAIYNLFDTPALLDAAVRAAVPTRHDAELTGHPPQLLEPAAMTFMGGEYDPRRRAAPQLGMDASSAATSRRRSTCNRDRIPTSSAATRTAVVPATARPVRRPNLGAPRKPGDPMTSCKTDGAGAARPQNLPGGGVPAGRARGYDGVCARDLSGAGRRGGPGIGLCQPTWRTFGCDRPMMAQPP